jgi:2-polyprenyl-6-methoxyphenol hydroxylase-like FAD-dependent oxidoreductase
MAEKLMEVLVVGGGPVGLTMAAELARHGVRCRIIDKLAVPSGYCKAIGVTPRTLEVWDDMGIAREMIDAGLWLRGMRMIIAGQPTDSLIDFPDCLTATSDFLNSPPNGSSPSISLDLASA